MKSWICPNCESNNSETSLCDVCDFDPLVVIRAFTISKNYIFEGEEILITWEIENYSNILLEINDKTINVSGVSTYTFSSKRSSKLKKIFKINIRVFDVFDNEIEVSEKFEQEVVVLIKPKINKFSVSNTKVLSGNEVTITWDILKYQKLFLCVNDIRKDISNLENIAINPTVDTYLYIEIQCLDADLILKTDGFMIDVFNPIELSFMSDKRYIVQSEPVKLFWTSQNATLIKINSDFDSFKKLSSNGFIESFPSKECSYKIIASNDVETKEDIIHINVFPIPSVSNIYIPSLPPLLNNLTFPKIDLESKIIDVQDFNEFSKFNFHDIDTYKFLAKTISDYTSNNKILNLIKKRIHD